MHTADLVEPLQDGEDGISNNDRPSMISNNNASVLELMQTTELDKKKLKHRIFAQFMKDDDSDNEAMHSSKTAQTAATANFNHGRSDSENSTDARY